MSYLSSLAPKSAPRGSGPSQSSASCFPETAVTAWIDPDARPRCGLRGAGRVRILAGTADGLAHRAPDRHVAAVMDSRPVVPADLRQPSLKRWRGTHAESRHCAGASGPDRQLRPAAPPGTGGRGTGGGEGPASAAQARPSGAGKAWREKRARPTGGRPRPQGSSGRAIPGDLVSLGPLCCSVDTGLRPTPRPPPKLPRLAVFGHRPLLTHSSP